MQPGESMIAAATRPRRVHSPEHLMSMTPLPGDVSFRGEDPRNVWVVIGTLPSRRLEAVSWDHLERRSIQPTGIEELVDGVADGRYISHALPARELIPMPEAIFEDVMEARDDAT
mgnify:CR=1 FL=1